MKIKETCKKGFNFVKEHKEEILTGVAVIATGIICLKTLDAAAKFIDNNAKAKDVTKDIYTKAYNSACDIANETLIPEINAKYSGYDFSNITDSKIMKVYEQYIEEYENAFANLVQEQYENLR